MTLLLLVHLLLQGPVERARALVDEGRSLEALALLERAAREQPDDAELHHALGALYAAGGRGPEALASIERAIALVPDDPSYQFAYGELLYRSGRVEDSVAPLENAESLPEALMVLAAAYEKLGPKEKVFSTLTRYLELRPDDVSARLLLGQQLEAARRYDEALDAYGVDSEDPVLQFHAADLLGKNRDTYEQSETLARAVLEKRPDMLEAGLLLARLLDRQGHSDEALAELERLRDLHPDGAQVHYNLTAAYQKAGRAEEARAAAELFQKLSAKAQEAVEREARVAGTYKSAAELLQRGNMLEAETVFESILEIDPEHAQTRSMLAKIAFSKGDVAAARRWIEEAIARDDHVAEYHYLHALFALRSNARDVAVASVQRSLELDPAFPDGWSMLGTLFLDAGRAKESVECFLKAAALEPSSATVQLNLASAYGALGNETEEANAMRRYRELSER